MAIAGRGMVFDRTLPDHPPQGPCVPLGPALAERSHRVTGSRYRGCQAEKCRTQIFGVCVCVHEFLEKASDAIAVTHGHMYRAPTLRADFAKVDASMRFEIFETR